MGKGASIITQPGTGQPLHQATPSFTKLLTVTQHAEHRPSSHLIDKETEGQGGLKTLVTATEPGLTAEDMAKGYESRHVL